MVADLRERSAYIAAENVLLGRGVTIRITTVLAQLIAVELTARSDWADLLTAGAAHRAGMLRVYAAARDVSGVAVDAAVVAALRALTVG